MTEDIRWIQRFSHFTQALSQLQKFIDKGSLTELEEQGLIQAFEYTYELAWNTLKDYFEDQSETDIHGSRDAIRLAFRRGLIAEGEVWMEMLSDRALTVHTYNQAIARKISDSISQHYYPEFKKLEKTLNQIKAKNL